MLKKTPGVQVSNGQVSITGKSSASVMINDRLLTVDGPELEALLRSIPASGVSVIEVITTHRPVMMLRAIRSSLTLSLKRIGRMALMEI